MRAHVGIALQIALLAVICAGCASRGGDVPTGRKLSLAEFVDADRADMAAVDDGVGVPAGAEVDSAPGKPLEPSHVAAGDGAGLGAESDMSDTSDMAGTIVIVDSLVGQVNGRPVYAGEFFEEVGDRLAAEAELLPRLSFERKAAEIIFERLQQVVINELVLAEAESNVPVEQQQGLLNWLRQQQISRGGGTRGQAEKRAQTLEGVSLEELIERQRDEQLVIELLRSRIERNVIVTWRDIEREYGRRFEEFNPPRQLVLARIRLSTARQPELIETVRSRLEAGDAFDEVATVAGMEDGGLWDRHELTANGLEDVELRAEIKDSLRLEAGWTAGPLELGQSTWWVHVVEVVQPPGTELYDRDLQRLLAQQIRSRRRAEEHNRFIGELMEGGIFDELRVMADRLLAIAILRYAQR